MCSNDTLFNKNSDVVAESNDNNKDMTVELIREELRDEMTLNRKLQRDAKVNKNRFVLGKLPDNDDVYTEEFVTVTAKNLRKKSLPTDEYRKLQNALIQSENHINAFFNVNNAVQGLMRDLSGTATQSKVAAANCCCNLSLGNSKACLTLSKFAAPYLIAELESTNEPLAEVCAWTIGNLTVENEKALSVLHAQDCFKSLIHLAKQCSDTLLSAASYAALRYIHTGADLIELADIVRLCEIIVERYSTISDIDTIWLLAILSSKPECIQHIIKCTPIVCNYLFDATSQENHEVEKISAALRIVCNTISETSGQVALNLFSGTIQGNYDFFHKLLKHERIHIRQETLWLLGNLHNHHLQSVQEISKPIIISSIPFLKEAIKSVNEIT